MIRILFLSLTVLLLISGISLLASVLFAFATEFASLQMTSQALTPRLFRLLGGIAILACSRWTLQVGMRH